MSKSERDFGSPCPIFGIDNMTTLLAIIVVFAGLVAIAVVVLFELRKTPKQEAEMIEHEDEAMSKVSGDPRQMAKWVP